VSYYYAYQFYLAYYRYCAGVASRNDERDRANDEGGNQSNQVSSEGGHGHRKKKKT